MRGGACVCEKLVTRSYAVGLFLGTVEAWEMRTEWKMRVEERKGKILLSEKSQRKDKKKRQKEKILFLGGGGGGGEMV